MTRSKAWIVAAFCALLAFGIPYLVITALAERHPEIRLILTGSDVSALIVDGDARILVVNSNDRASTRSSLGRLARPWEPEIPSVIAPATEAATPGIWEAIGHPAVRQLAIAGLPGSDPVWAGIEEQARTRDIEVIYAGEPVLLQSANLTITIEPEDSADSAYVRVASQDLVVVIGLGARVPAVSAHTLVASFEPPEGSTYSLTVLPASSVQEAASGTVLMDRREVVTLRLEGQQMIVRGGRYIPDGAQTN